MIPQFGARITFGVSTWHAFLSLDVGFVSDSGQYDYMLSTDEKIRHALNELWQRDFPRRVLQLCARQIAANNDTQPVSKLTALRKIFVQERRDRSRPGNPRVGWKRGEIFEVIHAALFDREHLAEEWGDIGYHTAQSYDALWKAYKFVTPRRILHDACIKYVERARRGMRK